MKSLLLVHVVLTLLTVGVSTQFVGRQRYGPSWDKRSLRFEGSEEEDPSKLQDGLILLTNSSDGGKHVIPPKTMGAFSYGEGSGGWPSQNFVPMYEDAHFPIASNTKIYLAVCIYQLHEQGQFSMDQDIATLLDATDFEKFGLSGKEHNSTVPFCPKLANASAESPCEVITMRQLLSMSSGMYPSENCDVPAATRGECKMYDWVVSPGSMTKMVGTFLLNPLTFKPGTSYHYNNPSFVLGSYFVEKFSGLTFAKYLAKNIFNPLNLRGSDSYYDWFNNQFARDPQRVRQYYKTYNSNNMSEFILGDAVMQLDLGVLSGSGGIVSTASAFRLFWNTLFNGTTKGAPFLKNPQSIQDILAPVNFVQNQSIPYGPTTVNYTQYYSQGIGIVCLEYGCPKGHPDFILYEGGSYTVHTANMVDYRTGSPGLFAQVWTSTFVYSMTNEQATTLQESQTGVAMDALMPYVVDNANRQLNQAMALLLTYAPPLIH